MASVFIAQCQGCGFKQDVIQRTNYAYRLAEPPDVFLWTQFSWCPQCQKVAQAEKLLTATEMDEWVEGRTDPKICRDMERYRQMMTSRTSPARCLECGSTNIVAATGERQERLIFHPACGSTIVLHHNGFVRLSGTDVYSPEGEHLTTVDGILTPGRGY